MAKDFSSFLGPKKKKSLNLLGEQGLSSKNSSKEESTASQPIANRNSTVSQPLDGEGPEKSKTSQPLARPLAQPLVNRNLTVSQPLAENLSGKKRKLLIWLFNMRHSTGDTMSSPIDNETLISLLENRSLGAMRNLLSQLKSKGFIEIFPIYKLSLIHI